MTCLFAAILGGVIASVLYELVFPPVVRRRPPALSPEVRRERAERRDRGVLNDGDPPPAPLVADPKLMTHLITSGSKVPPPYPELNDGSQEGHTDG